MLDYGMIQPLPHSNHKQCNFPYKIDGLMGGHVPPPLDPSFKKDTSPHVEVEERVVDEGVLKYQPSSHLNSHKKTFPILIQ